LKNVGQFATASRRMPHCHSRGVATVARRLRIDVHKNNDDDDDNNDNAWQRGPLEVCSHIMRYINRRSTTTTTTTTTTTH